MREIVPSFGAFAMRNYVFVLCSNVEWEHDLFVERRLLHSAMTLDFFWIVNEGASVMHSLVAALSLQIGALGFVG